MMRRLLQEWQARNDILNKTGAFLGNFDGKIYAGNIKNERNGTLPRKKAQISLKLPHSSPWQAILATHILNIP
jgi:hypothetical protein